MGIEATKAVEDLVGAYPTCSQCGQTSVVRDAWAEWNLLTRDWTLKTVFDQFACNACGKEIAPVWKIDEEFRLKRIQRLNDALRRGQGKNATIVVTNGVQNLGENFLAKVRGALATFDAFTEHNDPHKEHDFGAINIEDEKLFWKIDYFDLAMQAHSPDKANPVVTHRVLTIMQASEY